MKYFSPSYWFKLWLLSAPLFNDETIGINAKSIDNKKIKDWASKNTTDISLITNQELSLANNQTSLLNLPLWNTNLTTHNKRHKLRHQKSRNRLKRQPNQNWSRQILQLTEKLIINLNNSQQYRNGIQSILESLTNNDILRIVYDDSQNMNWGENSRIFTLNTENYGYFRLPVSIIEEENGQSYSRNLELVFRTDNLYIQGFIVNNNYYYFDFRNINMNRQSQAVRDGTVPLLTEIEGMTNRELARIGPDYRDLISDELPHRVYWTSVYQAFLSLYNIENPGSHDNDRYNTIRYSLGIAILVTSEAMRFPNIYSNIVENLIFHNDFINFQRNRNNPIYNTLVNWGERSRNEIFQEMLMDQIENRNNGNWNGFTMAQLIWELGGIPVQIVLGYINRVRNRNIQQNDNCHRQKRNVINKFWHEKFCDLKTKSDKIQGEITAIHLLNANLLYLGTTKGLYAIDNDIVYKNSEVNEVKKISNQGWKISVIDNDSRVWNIETNEHKDWRQKRNINLLDVKTDELIKTDIISENLNCYINLYYDNYKKEKIISSEDWRSNNNNNQIYHTFNLGYNSPFDYQKIEFLGSDSNFKKSRISWGDDICHVQTPLNLFNGVNINSKNKDYIKNFYVFDTNSISDINQFFLQPKINWKTWHSTLEWSISFGLTAYEEHNNWKLQILSRQYAHSNTFSVWSYGGSLFTEIGKGIRLYNDNCDNDKKRKREINKNETQPLKNVTKWTDKFTKDINHEHHLAIDNKPNFSTSNITSL